MRGDGSNWTFRKTPLFLLMQHSKAVAGYHGFNPGNDAIVMGCGTNSLQRLAAFRGRIAGCVVTGRLRGYRSRQNGGLHCPRPRG
jgi:hypothetical protein